MKNNIFLPFILLLLLCNMAKAQTAKGGCTSVTVLTVPSYAPNLYLTGGVSWTSCGDAGDPCCRMITFGAPSVPRFYLERLGANGAWSAVMGPQRTYVFEMPDGLAIHGTYRVRMNLPVVDGNACESGVPLPCYDTALRLIGFWGTWGPDIFTNNVIVGKTVPADNVFSFVDGDGLNSMVNGFDYQEIASIDASGSKNYDQWWLAVTMLSNGASQHTGWQFNQAGLVNLNNVWNKPPHEEWEFWPGLNYEVLFVVENSKCQNGDGWNEKKKTFYSCPFGSGCRFDEGVKPEAVISPNPASNTLRLSNFEPSVEQKYELTITDMLGKTLKNVQGWNNNDLDISDLPLGTYILKLMGNDKPLFSDQFIVVR